jgi:hypothetical protein
MTTEPGMNLPHYLRRLMLVASCAMPFAAYAVDPLFLKDSPVSYFKQEDVDLMMKNAREVLDSSSPTAKQAWANPKTGASGFAQVKGQFTATDGAPCKELRVSNQYKHVSGEATYTVCKYKDRGWIVNVDAEPAR